MRHTIRALLGGILLLSGGAQLRASLEIYPDGVIYRTVSVDTYVGFVSGARAWCGLEPVALERRYSCLEAKRLCRERQEIDELSREVEEIARARKALEQWSDALRPGVPDATAWITSAKKLGEKQARWHAELQKSRLDLERKKERFSRQVSAPRPLFLGEECKAELELRLPGGLVEAGVRNEAILQKEKILIRRYVTLRNHSGIDLVSKDTRIYARALHRPLRPSPFLSWPKKADGNASERSPSSFPDYFVDRDYAVGKVNLPTDGREIRVLVERYEVPRQCTEVLYSWRDLEVYRACRFRTPGPVGSDRWIVRRDERDRGIPAAGMEDEGKYLLLIGRDESVKVERRIRLLGTPRHEAKGVRQSWELRLTLHNSQDRQKTVKIVERLPGSDGGVETEIEKIEGAIREAWDESTGRLVVQAVLAPKESREVRIRFTVRSPKALKLD